MTYEYKIVPANEGALAPLAAEGWRVAHVLPPSPVLIRAGSSGKLDASPRLLLERPVADSNAVVDKDAVAAALAELVAHGGTIPGLGR
jgi:hypothetical protein